MTYPLDPIHHRETKEKTNFTLPANSSESIFYEENEDGWVTEVFIYCTGDLTLDIFFGPNKESMKISDAQSYGLTHPNTTFWVPVYDTSNNLFAIAYQPFYPQPYKGSVNVVLKNEESSPITLTRAIFRRIMQSRNIEELGGSEFPPYSVKKVQK